ncbi:MAG: bifunctional serine/threonine-protein kinase/ABC transporter substrate-binding protein [Egibacteraceae bacterium]
MRFEISGFTNVVEVSAGGFSTVYRADQPRFSRTVVVKVLHVYGLTSSFERECRALGMLGGHPNVVSVFDAALDKSGRPYIVMEYLPAGSLADRLEADGQLSWEAVLAIGVKLAGALESAHQADVVHLDVKPANVLVGTDGEPKLADFGIARMRAALGAKRATQTLALTPGYAAPERFKEDEPTVAADVYGLGATLFTLLVGHSPFLRSRDEQPWPEVIIGRVLYEPVPELDPGFPQGLRAVARRAMAKSPADRFGSAAELGEALRAVQRDHELAVTSLLVVPVADIPAPLPPPVRHRRLAMVSLLAVVTLVAGAVIAFVRPSPCARPQADGALSFGTLLPKTGQFLYSGPAMQAGVQLAMKDVNAAGAIAGIVVKLDEANQHDEGDPFSGETASKATDPLLSGRVDVLIGPATSAVAGKVIDKVVCAGVIVFSPANSASVFTTYDDRGLYFRTAPSNVFRGPLLGELVVADGNSTAVVIARDDLSGNDFRRLIEQAIKASGGSVLDSFSYDPTAPNHDRDVQRIKDKNPDAVVLSGFSESASILREMIEQGLGPQRKRVYAGTTMSNTLPRLVNPQDPGVLAGMRGMFVDEGSEAFVRRLREVDPGLQEFTFGAETYDAVVVTALAAAVAGTDAPAAIAEQINGVTKGGEKCTSYADCVKLVRERKNIDYDGASGPLEFADPGEPSSATYVISEFQADGSLKPLRTVAAGSAT